MTVFLIEGETIFREIFIELIRSCINKGIVDGSFLSSQVSKDSQYDVITKIRKSTVCYLNEPDQELASLSGYKEPQSTEVEKPL